MKNFVASLVALCGLLFSINSASAETLIEEVAGGLLAQGCCGQAEYKEQGVAFNGEAQFRSPQFLSVLGSPRPVIGANIATDSDATSQFYAGFTWQFDLTEKVFFNAMLGGALHNGEAGTFDAAVDMDRMTNTSFLGCRGLFRLAGDLGYRVSERVSVMAHWSHLSNAGLCTDNEGLDNLGVRIGYTF